MIDELVFKKAKNGNKESFYKLLEPIQSKLYKIAFIYVNDEEDALDCIHDTIIKAIQSINTLKEPKYFNTWICKIMVNTCKDYIKKNKKIIIQDIKDFENKLIFEEKTINNYDDIDYILNLLTEKEKNLIVMRYIDDMSFKDIAKSYNSPIGTIKSSISRIIKKLKFQLKGAKL